jgi:hypothetical protein
MSEAQEIKAKVFVPGQDKRPPFHRLLTLDMVCDWIKVQGLDEYTTNGLIQLARGYPTQALPSFRKNFNVMIQRVRQKRKQEQNQPIDDRPDDWQENAPEIVLEEKKDDQDQN